MGPVVFLVDSSPYGYERAFGALNAAAVCLPIGSAVALYADGVYLALADQRGHLAGLMYAYPEIDIFAHEPSMAERGLLSCDLSDRVEMLDDLEFVERIRGFRAMVVI
ncbi:MAG: sulfur reduction protein DsrE [Methanothrix sp.]|jgi:tRNA 2-thiouridine synthesizing protein C|uniref:DsrE family protein n=1 Tax=Methanothrix sp. TaxID=90426 RepID=UPI00247E2DFF|nr:sulfur reduction protein DsrE [Methanothrix sp.]